MNDMIEKNAMKMKTNSKSWMKKERSARMKDAVMTTQTLMSSLITSNAIANQKKV